ncbi:hypothetical protein [Methylobacterium trifolii]|uniref:Uncharacterized protein n=1 Tax=Methylobacterium trifolii TaxID=1003092 RepID=A0ABQ4TYB7_9HYPH|nr:hypothetical protein [Methylobacterium trifolii]GJE59047.1 hypothetical protein MPOCJGCO_1134 [Methylobacterium trifolii]
MTTRARLRAILAGTAVALAAGSAAAQEPLFLRIRPQGAPEIGGGSDEAVARAARAAREAVWERSAVRARRAIASVCTGCLKDWPAQAGVRQREARPQPNPTEPPPAAGALAGLSTPLAAPFAAPLAAPFAPSNRGDP